MFLSKVRNGVCYVLYRDEAGVLHALSTGSYRRSEALKFLLGFKHDYDTRTGTTTGGGSPKVNREAIDSRPP